MKLNRILLALCLLVPGMAFAQSSCPSGYEKAEGFRVQNPNAAAGTYVYPLCVKVSDGSVLFQGDMKVQVDVTPKSAAHLVLNTSDDDKQVRINSRNFTQASGSSIAFQSKPAQTVTTTGDVIGGEISPRLNSGVAAGNIIGLHVDSYLKGTAAGTVSGDVRGQQIELVTDDAGTRTISGDVVGLRMRSAFSATTITGNFVAFKVEKPEAQTNSKTYDALFKLTSTIAGVWNNAPGTEPTTADGYIKVIINGAVRYIQLYSGAPVD